jgi:hypothetical protein
VSAVSVVLTANGTLRQRTVVARHLRLSGLTAGLASALVERLADEGTAACQVPTSEAAARLAASLVPLGVELRRVG